MPEETNGCVKPARGPLTPEGNFSGATGDAAVPRKEGTMLASVGKEPPDFEANAFVPGAGFRTVRLSDYKGQWIVLCFYPGDFTFV